MLKFVATLIASLLLSCMTSASFAEENAVTEHSGLVYATYGKREMALDLYTHKSDTPQPVIVLVHGGGWVNGNRQKFTPFAKAFAQQGYAVANVSYRLAKEEKFPGAVIDVKNAVRWVRKHAAKYNLDPQRIAGVGGSAGGHLIAMVATTPGKWEDEAPVKAVTSELQAAVVLGSGVDQVARVKETKGLVVPNATLFLGATYKQNPEIYRQASPITHVSKSTPPFLFLDGSLDRPGERYVGMQKKLDVLDRTHAFKVIEGAKHGAWNREPFRSQYVKVITDWLNETLK